MRYQKLGNRVADLTLICNPNTGIPIANFGSIDDPRLNALATIDLLLQQVVGQQNTIASLLQWVNFQNRPIDNLSVKAYACADYNLLNGGTIEIPENRERRGLRIINASGNGSGLNQSDILLGTRYVPDTVTFNRSIAFGEDPLLDAPGLQQFVGCVPIGGQPLEGFFTIVEMF
jgi:hypothetical protein